MLRSVPVADAFLLFGATGDLARKKLFPALYELTTEGRLDIAALVAGFAGGARVAGTTIRSGVSVSRLNQEGSRVTGVRLSDGTDLVSHAEDIGRHNAVDKVIGSALLEQRSITDLGLLVTGRISAELAFKAYRAGLAYVATPSVPSTIARDIAQRSGMTLVGRAASGTPDYHRPE